MDTRDTKLHNLLFLLSAAPLGMACVIAGDDTDTEGATETPTTETPGATETAGTTETPPGDTTETPPGDTTETPSDTTVTPPGETTTGGVEIPAACATYAELVTSCYDEQAGATAAMYCAENLAYYEVQYGAECVTAFEEWLACLSALTCEEFTGPDPVCEEQQGALDTACAPA